MIAGDALLSEKPDKHRHYQYQLLFDCRCIGSKKNSISCIGKVPKGVFLHADVVFETKKKLPLRVDFTTTFGELLDHTKTAPVITELLAPLAAAAASAEGMSDEYKKLGEQVIREMPLKSLLGQMPGEQVEQLIGQLNCLLAQ